MTCCWWIRRRQQDNNQSQPSDIAPTQTLHADNCDDHLNRDNVTTKILTTSDLRTADTHQAIETLNSIGCVQIAQQLQSLLREGYPIEGRYIASCIDNIVISNADNQQNHENSTAENIQSMTEVDTSALTRNQYQLEPLHSGMLVFNGLQHGMQQDAYNYDIPSASQKPVHVSHESQKVLSYESRRKYIAVKPKNNESINLQELSKALPNEEVFEDVLSGRTTSAIHREVSDHCSIYIDDLQADRDIEISEFQDNGAWDEIPCIQLNPKIPDQPKPSRLKSIVLHVPTTTHNSVQTTAKPVCGAYLAACSQNTTSYSTFSPVQGGDRAVPNRRLGGMFAVHDSELQNTNTDATVRKILKPLNCNTTTVTNRPVVYIPPLWSKGSTPRNEADDPSWVAPRAEDDAYWSSSDSQSD